MKTLFVALAMVGVCLAQNATSLPPNPVAPASARKFTTRNLGAGGSGVDVGIREVPRETTKPETKKIQLIGVTEPRVWTSADGRVVRAALLAYEEGPVPKESAKPLTLVRDGRIRLLVEGRTTVSSMPLDQLAEGDRDYVKALIATLAKAAEK